MFIHTTHKHGPLCEAPEGSYCLHKLSAAENQGGIFNVSVATRLTNLALALHLHPATLGTTNPGPLHRIRCPGIHKGGQCRLQHHLGVAAPQYYPGAAPYLPPPTARQPSGFLHDQNHSPLYLPHAEPARAYARRDRAIAVRISTFYATSNFIYYYLPTCAKFGCSSLRADLALAGNIKIFSLEHRVSAPMSLKSQSDATNAALTTKIAGYWAEYEASYGKQ
ncbi:hypothetical protein B0H14DRAFT_3149075 [Mycena olivaceomarginata]|nr:hypothetical protein B0H14DRAFT_3149075 [Mycena olivaceomarginata]